MVTAKKVGLILTGLFAMLVMWAAALTVIAPLNNLSGLDALICQSTAFVFGGVGFGSFVLSILGAEEIY